MMKRTMIVTKYGEEFEYVQPWGNSMSVDHELVVTCESLAGERILVSEVS